jgi:hypothetical protein
MWRRGTPWASGVDAKHVTLIRTGGKGKLPSISLFGGKTSFSSLYKTNLCGPSSSAPLQWTGRDSGFDNCGLGNVTFAQLRDSE